MSAELAGTLRERVAIETRVGTRDGLAGATGKYAYAGEAWASLMPAAPGAVDSGDALSSLPRWKVTMRKREGVGLQTRLIWRRKYLGVRAVKTDPREPALMVLTCEELR